MKKIVPVLSGLMALSSLMLLSSCSQSIKTRGDWSTKCDRHYSINSRELSECKAKVADGRRWEVEPNTVSIDPNQHQSFDSLGKGGVRDAF